MADAMRSFVVTFADPGGKEVHIPRAFMEAWGHHLGDVVVLQHSDGKSFRMELKRRNNRAWLGRGWSSFKSYNRIEFRDSLYFMYKWGNVFDCVVLGCNGIQKMRRSEFTNKAPFHFFKKADRRSFASKLVLPDAFTSLCGQALANPMTVYAPDLTNYDVSWEWNTQENCITFVGGWAEFVNWVEVQRNDLLIFLFDWSSDLPVDVIKSDSSLFETFHIPEERVQDHMVGNVFEIKLTLGSAQKGQPLYIPAPIAKQFFKNKPPTIRVILPSGEEAMWLMIYSVERKEVKIGGRGWYDFMEENEFAEGDVLKFERKGLDYYEVNVLKN